LQPINLGLIFAFGAIQLGVSLLIPCFWTGAIAKRISHIAIVSGIGDLIYFAISIYSK
jgi:hypothetical protein